MTGGGLLLFYAKAFKDEPQSGKHRHNKATDTNVSEFCVRNPLTSESRWRDVDELSCDGWDCKIARHRSRGWPTTPPVVLDGSHLEISCSALGQG